MRSSYIREGGAIYGASRCLACYQAFTSENLKRLGTLKIARAIYEKLFRSPEKNLGYT